MLRRGIRNFFKVYRKNNTVIVPTISLPRDTTLNAGVVTPKTFNNTVEIDYSYVRDNLQAVIDSQDVKESSLLRLNLDIAPNFKEFLQTVQELSKTNIMHVKIKSDEYFIIERFVQKEETFPHIITTIENPELSQEQLIGVYDAINHPMDIGLSTSNAVNFNDSATETRMRIFFKNMFKFSTQIKLIEIDYFHLQHLFQMSSNTQKSPLKCVTFQTLLDFTQVVSSKTFFDISLASIGQAQPDEHAISETLQKADAEMLKNGFELDFLNTKGEVLALINNVDSG